MTTWYHAQAMEAVEYRCGYCDREIGTNLGYLDQHGGNDRIYICPRCTLPTYWQIGTGAQVPGPAFGNDVGHLPSGVDALYKEARDSIKAGAHTGSVLLCRKLLMHIAVDQGADEGKSFLEYVEYLADNGYVPPGGKGWVDHIRKRGNEANHEINEMQQDDATDLVTFTEMLLKFVYELPRSIPGGPPAA